MDLDTVGYPNADIKNKSTVQVNDDCVQIDGRDKIAAAKNKEHRSDERCSWWGMVDSNHRRHSQQIYSLSPLATREIPHIYFVALNWLEPVDGLEPPTC